MVDSLWQNDHVTRKAVDADPLVFEGSYIKEAGSLGDESNLLVRMQMLLIERLDLHFIVWERVLMDSNDIVVIVATSVANTLELLTL